MLGFEREMRIHRAHVESQEVTMLGPAVDGSYRVRGASGASYFVDVADRSELHDSCTCPDFLTGEIGICKHLAAVHRALREQPAFRRAYAALGVSPSRPTLTVSARGGLALQLAGPAIRRFARRLRLRANDAGVVTGADGLELPPPAAGGAERVVYAVLPAVKLLASRAAARRRASEVERALESGELGVDLLREPLFPYQLAGVAHLVRNGRALLADDMGLGKTVQSIAACELLRRRGEARRILVVAPASLKEQWAREIARYTGETAVVVGGNLASRRRALGSDAAYTIINYELTWRDLSILQNLGADVMVLDEAQRAKNFRTKTAATLRALESRFLFVLTGTPIENRLDDLYALLQLVDPALLGPLWRFNLDFQVQNARGKVTGYKNLSALRARVAPVVLRRRKEEVLGQLPPLTLQARYVPLDEAQTELEAHFRTEASKLMATAERRALRKEEQERLMMLLLKARQACDAARLCDPALDQPSSPKLDEFTELVREITEQGASKILVFSEWTEMLKLAAECLDTLSVQHLTLHGGVPADKRPALLDRFRNDAAVRVLLSTDAGGVGLNLQVATYVIHLDLPWNPGKLDQRIARAHRLGQTRGVTVTYLCAESGIERGIEGTLDVKRALRHAALDSESETEQMEAPSFVAFIRTLRQVIEDVDGPSGVSPTGEESRAVADPLPASIAAEAVAPATGEIAVAPKGPASSAAPSDGDPQGLGAGSRTPLFVQDRLRLAKVVLAAGFPADAVRAAYDALAGLLRHLLGVEGALGHATLVARLYGELIPSGKVPMALHVALSRAHDLTLLDGEGVRLDSALAGEVVAEVESWLHRGYTPVVEIRESRPASPPN